MPFCLSCWVKEWEVARTSPQEDRALSLARGSVSCRLWALGDEDMRTISLATLLKLAAREFSPCSYMSPGTKCRWEWKGCKNLLVFLVLRLISVDSDVDVISSCPWDSRDIFMAGVHRNILLVTWRTLGRAGQITTSQTEGYDVNTSMWVCSLPQESGFGKPKCWLD